jgi:hypothetical protein
METIACAMPDARSTPARVISPQRSRALLAALNPLRSTAETWLGEPAASEPLEHEGALRRERADSSALKLPAARPAM